MGDNSVKWFVRGVPEELTKAVAIAAKARGMTVGRLVTDALRAHLEALECGERPAAAPPLQRELEALQERVATLEARFRPDYVPKQKPAVTAKPRLPQGEKERIDALLRAGVTVKDILKIVPGARQTSVYRRYEALRAQGEA